MHDYDALNIIIQKCKIFFLREKEKRREREKERERCIIRKFEKKAI